MFGYTGSPFALGDIGVIDSAADSISTSFGAGNRPVFIAFLSDGSKAYVSNTNSADVSVIDAITDQVIKTVPVGQQPVDIAVVPKIGTNKFTYAISPAFGFPGSTDQISAFQVNPSTGVLTSLPGFPLNLGFLVTEQLAIDPGDNFLFLTEDATNAIGVFRINPATGALTQVSGSPFLSGWGVETPVVHPTGKFLFVTNVNPTGGNSISVFAISPSGTLTPVAGSPFIAGVNVPFGAVVDPTGRFLYVSNLDGGTGNVSAYSIDSNTGSLAQIPGSPFNVCSQCPFGNTSYLVIEPGGKFLYGTGSSQIWAATINPTTGALTPLPLAGTSASPLTRVAMSPTGKFLFAANGLVGVFSIDPTTGALTAVPGSPFPASNSMDASALRLTLQVGFCT